MISRMKLNPIIDDKIDSPFQLEEKSHTCSGSLKSTSFVSLRPSGSIGEHLAALFNIQVNIN